MERASRIVEDQPSRHSPGPWKVHPRGRSCPGYDVCDRIISDSWTGRTLYSDGLSDADAQLISSAPELLVSLRDLLAECERHGSFAEVGFHHQLVKPVFDAARAAIAKAEGQS